MMDALAAYGSESDDADDENTCENGDNNKDSTGLDSVQQDQQRKSHSENTTSDPHCFDLENQSADSAVTTVNTAKSTNAAVNYFGFASSSSTHAIYPDEDDYEERELSVHGNMVEVPAGDFWKDLSADEVTSASDSSVRKRVFESVQIYSQQMCKKPAYDVSINSRGGGIESSRNSQKSSAEGDVQSDTTAHPSKPVKVFTVHPTISPHLQRLHGNRCPSKELKRWGGHPGIINRISWCSNAPFSHLLASAGADSVVRVWNAWGQLEPCVSTLTHHSKAVRDVQWSADGRRILTCSYDRTAAITDVESGKMQVQMEHSGFVSCGKIHPVTPHLLATGTTGCIQVWDTRHPDVPIRIFTHKEEMGQVQDLLFSHNGQELFSCGDVVTRESADRSILAWDWRSGVVLSNQIFQERYTVTRLVMHPSDSQFMAQTQAGYIAMFSTQRPYKMNKNKRFEGHKTDGYGVGLSVSPDGTLVYSGSSDGRLHCYSFNNTKRIRTLNCGQVALDVVAHPVLPSVVAVASADGDIVLYQ